MAAAGYPGSYAKGELIENIPAESDNAKVFHAGTECDADGHLRSAGGRVLCAVGLGSDIREAQQRAYRLVGEINWPTAFYRRDIGFKALK